MVDAMRFCHGNGLYNIKIDNEILELQRAEVTITNVISSKD
jgi:hypothetical protein